MYKARLLFLLVLFLLCPVRAAPSWQILLMLMNVAAGVGFHLH